MQNNNAVDKGKIEHRLTMSLLDLSTRLIQASPQDIDVEIGRALNAVRKQLELDDLHVFRFSDAPEFHATVFASSTEREPSYAATILEEELPWMLQKIKERHPLHLKQLPVGLSSLAKDDKQYIEKFGNRLLHLKPICIGGTEWGFLWASCSENHSDVRKIATQLGTLRNLITAAIQRKITYDHISSLLQFGQLISDISAKYINLPVEDIEKNIRQDLGRLGQQMEADRCLLYLIDDDKKSYSTCSNRFFWYPHEEAEIVRTEEKFLANTPDFDVKYFQYLFAKWRMGEPVMWSSQDELPPEAHMLKLANIQFDIKSHLSVPMSFNQQAVGAIVILSRRYNRKWHPDIIRRVRQYGEVFANAFMRKKSDEKLNQAFTEIKELKERIESDYIYLKDETDQEFFLSGIIGESTAIKSMLLQLKKVAATETTVLLLGETGTGKGVTARAIHKASSRRNRPLIQVNCASLSPSVIESELFGHEKGAYTGAESKRVGRFEIADGTTLFLDEIGELPIELQAKLLRVLESGEFERVGGSTTIKTDVRIIAATNKNLQQEAAAGKFRLDLWYRLSVFPLYLPPLRERTDDIQLFVEWFVDKYGTKKGRKFAPVSKESIAQLQKYTWPGNVRELENLVERAIIISEGSTLNIVTPNLYSDNSAENSYRFSDFEREHFHKVLEEHGWKIEGRGGAAEALDMNPGTLRSRLKKLGISRPS